MLLKATFPKSSQDSKAAKPQVSLQVPEGSGCIEPPASRGLLASVLLQPSLFLEVDSLRGLGFFFFISFFIIIAEGIGRRNLFKRQRHLPVHLCRQPVPACQGNLHKLSFFILQQEYSSVISKEMPAQSSLCKHCSHHSISAILPCELI